MNIGSDLLQAHKKTWQQADKLWHWHWLVWVFFLSGVAAALRRLRCSVLPQNLNTAWATFPGSLWAALPCILQVIGFRNGLFIYKHFKLMFHCKLMFTSWYGTANKTPFVWDWNRNTHTNSHTHKFTHTCPPAHSQHRHLPVMATPLLCLPGGRPPHQRPFLLAAAGADVLVASRPTDGVQVVAGVLSSSRRRARGYWSHWWGRGARAGGGERRARDGAGQKSDEPIRAQHFYLSRNKSRISHTESSAVILYLALASRLLQSGSMFITLESSPTCCLFTKKWRKVSLHKQLKYRI